MIIWCDRVARAGCLACCSGFELSFLKHHKNKLWYHSCEWIRKLSDSRSGSVSRFFFAEKKCVVCGEF